MVFANLELSPEQLFDCDWQDIPNQSEDKTCGAYHSLYAQKSIEAEEAGNSVCREIYLLLDAITSLMYQPNNRDLPYKPYMELRDRRSTSIEDIPESYLHILGEILDEISDPELQARVGDILWVKFRNHKAAETAISAYLESARRLEDPKNWPDSYHRILRASELAAMLGRDGESFNRVIEYVEEVLARLKGEDPLYFSSSLIQLLVDHRRGDNARYIAYCKKAAQFSITNKNWRRARDFWQHQAKLLRLEGDTTSERQALVFAAETYVNEADETKTKSLENSFVEAIHLQEAIAAFRQIGGMEERIKELKTRMIEVQKSSIGNFNQFSHTIDVSDIAKNAISVVEGKPFDEAIRNFVMLASPPQKESLKETVEKLVNDHPLQFLITSRKLNPEGRIIAHRPSLLTSDQDEAEIALRAEMLSQGNTVREFIAGGILEPARRMIASAHQFSFLNFSFLVLNNPFVPPGREAIFAQGFSKGLSGDYLLSAHLLAPQIENSIRYILMQNGIISSGLNSSQIQEDFTLSKLLYMDEVKTFMGEDLLFDLQGLLVEPFGANLRNRLAHGLLHQNDFAGAQFLYLFWLTMRLCTMVQRISVTDLKEQENA